MPIDHPIKIQVLNDTGDMAYSVSVQHAVAGDTVTWTSENGPFTLSFTTSPFNEGVQVHSGGPANTAVGTVKAGAAVGRYYYGVAVSYNGKIYTDPGCPEIIIR
jgi:plastocyanin